MHLLYFQSERCRSRRDAMVSCENLLSESSELFNTVQESTLKSQKNSGRKIYRSGGIFSNPFKSDSEKMEQLNDMLRQYREHGIPDVKHFPVGNGSKLNHLRASSLSMSGILGNNNHNTVHAINVSSSGGHTPSLLSTTKTSLSTTDLHHINHSTPTIAPLTLTTPGNQSPGQILSSSSFDASCDSNYYMEPDWRLIVENDDQLPARVQSQNEAIWELLQTEVFYIRRLKVIKDVFIACLLSLQSECLLTEVSAFSFWGR